MYIYIYFIVRQNGRKRLKTVLTPHGKLKNTPGGYGLEKFVFFSNPIELRLKINRLVKTKTRKGRELEMDEIKIKIKIVIN